MRPNAVNFPSTALEKGFSKGGIPDSTAFPTYLFLDFCLQKKSHVRFLTEETQDHRAALELTSTSG